MPTIIYLLLFLIIIWSWIVIQYAPEGSALVSDKDTIYMINVLSYFKIKF